MDIDELSLHSNNSDIGSYPDYEGDVLLFGESINFAELNQSKESIIFLIDCSPSMHIIIDKVKEKTTPLSSVLKVTENYLKTKIILNYKDHFGIVLYNTSIMGNELNFDGVNILTQSHPTCALTVKNIKDKYNKCSPEKNKNYDEELKAIFPSNEDNKNYLKNGLLVSQSILKTYDKNTYKRKILLFTNKDDPLYNDIQEKNNCIQLAKEMNDEDIIIEIYPMNFTQKFKLKNFYSNIIASNPNDDINSGRDNIINIEQSTNKFNKINKRIIKNEKSKKYLTKCILRISPNAKIYMNIYSNFEKLKIEDPYYVDARTNKILNFDVIKKDKQEKNPEHLEIEFGMAKVIFTQPELEKIKIKEEPGMTLMGFKSIDKIKQFYNLGESYFVYPNESFSKGSGKIINVLIKQLCNKRKCAIVKYISEDGYKIRLCALIPQIERYDEDYFQTPPGFNMILLPWAQDLMLYEQIIEKFPKNLPKVTKRQSEMARSIVKKMNFNFDIKSFSNYNVQKFYSTLQSIALGESNNEVIENKLHPNDEQIKKKLDKMDIKYKQSTIENNDNNGNSHDSSFDNKKSIKNKVDEKKNKAEESEEKEKNIKKRLE
jgi:ATP-dependent DNA helicase II